MQTIQFPGSATFKLLAITGAIIVMMAFKGPALPKRVSSFIATKDTAPQQETGPQIEIDKIIAEVNKAVAHIDTEKMIRQVEATLQKIDLPGIRQDINASLKNINWNKINLKIDSSTKNTDWKKMNDEIIQRLDEAQEQLNSKVFRESLRKVPQADLKKLKKELKKTQMEMEKSRQQLKKELRKMKDEDDAVMNLIS